MPRPLALLPLVALALVAAGCDDFLDLDFDSPWGPDVALFDDGTTLWISADPDGDPALAQLTITADGIRYGVPVRPDAAPPLLDRLFCVFCGLGPLKRALPSPIDRAVEVALNGATARVTLPATFPVEISATHLERSSEHEHVS